MPPENGYRDGKRPTKGVMKSSNEENFFFNFKIVKPVLLYSIICILLNLTKISYLLFPFFRNRSALSTL